jgi:hypothetical protein
MAPPPPQPAHQLSLPFQEQRECLSYPAEAVSVPPQRLWATLSPLQQNQIRTALLRVLQEVLHDASGY